MSFSLKKITESAEVELYTLTDLINIFIFFFIVVIKLFSSFEDQVFVHSKQIKR